MALSGLELVDALPPSELAFALHVGWETVQKSVAFKKRLELALVCSKTGNTEYARDVATVWACLHQKQNTRCEASPAVPRNGSTPSQRDVALALLAGRGAPTQISYLRYLLCQKYAASLLIAVPAPDIKYPETIHKDRFYALLNAFAHDCTFTATGDWMINARTTLLCPGWATTVTDGNQAPYTVATEIHGAELNNLLRPMIKTPIHEQLSEGIDDNPDTFVAMYAVIRELVPSTPVAINGEIFHHIGTSVPVPFYLRNFSLPGITGTTDACHGFLIGQLMHVSNGNGILDAATDWLYAMWLTGNAPDAASFVFEPEKMSDGNVYEKYKQRIEDMI